MKEFDIQSEFPCLVVTDNLQEFLNPTDVLTIQSNYAYIYPAECKEILPFKLDFNKTISKNYRIVEDREKNRCFLFAPNVLSKKNIEHIKIGSTNVEVVLSKRDLKIKSDEEEISLPIAEYSQYSCKSIENFLVLLLSNKKHEVLYLYNPKTKVFKAYKGKDFNFSKTEITFTYPLNDFAKSVFDKKLILNQNELKEENLSFKKENHHLQRETICYAFLECMLNKNYNLAREFLSSNFDNIENEKFNEFFGNFYKFFFLSSERYLLIYHTDNKIVNFKMENEKIIDFEII